MQLRTTRNRANNELLQQHADDTNKMTRLAMENVRMRGAIQAAMDKLVVDEFDDAYEILERVLRTLE